MSSRELATVQLKELAKERAILYPLSVETYHWMIDQGLLAEGEPFELLNGQVVRKDRSASGEDPMTVGHEHVLVVKRLAKLGPQFERLGCHLQTQQPISIPSYDEPEPDAAVVLGTEEDYRDRLPGPKDVLCVIEVADSSLHRDRTIKLRVYARAGIACYIIINLLERVVEVYRQPSSSKTRLPRYGKPQKLIPGDSLEIPAGDGRSVRIAVAMLLP